MVNIELNDKPNSYEFRYAGVDTKIKLYFKNAEDLEKQLQELNNSCNNVRHYTDNIKNKLGGNQ